MIAAPTIVIPFSTRFWILRPWASALQACETTFAANRAIRDELNTLLDRVDLPQLMRRAAFNGFDTYQDYERYGDLFVPLRDQDTGP